MAMLLALMAAAPVPVVAGSGPVAVGRQVLSLEGSWRFAAGGSSPGATQGALPDITFRDTILLPGTTDTRAKGPENPEHPTTTLTRLHRYVGPAWYDRAVRIPDEWRGKRVTLVLERTKYTQAWLDGRPFGASPILCTPQSYDLGTLAPGPHRLTIVVDNSRKPVNVEMHQMSENTQGNWNGIVGRIELVATDPVWLDDVQVYPDLSARRVRVTVAIGNASGTPGRGRLAAELVDAGVSGETAVEWAGQGGNGSVEIAVPPAVGAWDEFHPEVLRWRVRLTGTTADVRDERTVTSGLREFRTRGTQFTVNGRVTFLRGKHDGCVFPLTGHPPMDVDGWRRYLKTCQVYGINHIRFHTWTPPDAAFTAADELGVYLQPELPFWGNYTDDVKRALMPEAERILKVYGNHPSFVMLALGNECGGSRAVMSAIVRELRGRDPRHLYAQGSNNFFWDPKLAPGDDYWTTVRTRDASGTVRNVRGSFATVDGGNGHVQLGPPGTLHDYAAAISGVPVPVVGHEVGQYATTPDFREITRYTGVFRARNFEHFRDRFRSAGILDQADDLMRASGELAALSYREDTEAMLRTPGFGGFQLLDLQDFPGQGTALVGVLNAFMEPKGTIDPAAWRQFCAPVVPLARFERYTWTTDETFAADVQVAHYGPRDLPAAVLSWDLADAHGRSVARGALPATDVLQGGVRRLGRLSTPLAEAPAPSRLTLTLRLEGTAAANTYPLWAYPPHVATAPPPGVTLARALDAPARAALAGGGRVLIVTGQDHLRNAVGGGFTTDFWCWPMFHNRPGTMGLLCNPAHPALAGFPTGRSSEWQWFHLASSAQPLILDDLPVSLRPIVQVIDNLERAHRLGLIVEAKVGPGRLLVCATNLVALRAHPEARQLLRSLLDYAASPGFHPTTELPVGTLSRLLARPLPVKTMTASSTESDEHAPTKAVDSDPETRWCAATAAPAQWLQADLGETHTIDGCDVVWEHDMPGYAYLVEGSPDGRNWATLSDRRSGRPPADFTPARVRFVRVTVTGLPRGQWASVRELRVFEAG